MSRWIKASKSSWGFSASIVILDRVSFYAGKTDHWGIGVNLNLYDKALTFELLNLYTGIEILHKQ